MKMVNSVEEDTSQENENIYDDEFSDYYWEESDDESEEWVYGEYEEETDSGSDVAPNNVNDESDEEEEDSSYSEEKTKEQERYISEHLPALLDAIKECEQEGEVKSLDFDYEGLSVHHLQLIFDFLQNSQITELCVTDSINLKDELSVAFKKLKKTNLSKFSIDYGDSDVLSIAKVLEHTQITDLHIARVFEVCIEKWTKEFASYLPKSHLTSLSMTACYFFRNAQALSLVDSLPSTTITYLDLSSTLEDSTALIFLFATLPNTSITELVLKHCNITDRELKALCQTLKRSKLERLDLESNNISGAGFNFLTKSLVLSKVTDLSLAWNRMVLNDNDLSHHLKDTSIQILSLTANNIDGIFSLPGTLRDSFISTLTLENCGLSDEVGGNLMRSLKYSKVLKLNVESNRLGLQTVSEFVSVLKDTNITDVNFSKNYIPAEGLYILGECLKDSNVQHVKLSKNLETSSGLNAFAVFIEKTKGSKISVLDISHNAFQKAGIEIIAKSLINTTFTHLDLSQCSIEDGILSLASCLKNTAITHLKLRENKILDEGAEALAECIAETQINTLDVSKNDITNIGGKALASCLKNTSLYVLKLWGNKIDNQGIEDLANIIEGTFITEFDIKCYQSRKYLVMDTVLWKNRASVHKLLKFYKKIAPETGSNSFWFERNLDHAFITEFLDECLYFYKTIIEHPSAISAIAKDKTSSLSRQQVAKQLLEEFPHQLTAFIGSKIEADVLQHVQFLEKVEEMGLETLVELLLLNRPVLIIDEKEGILHPKVYKLLHKYKQPIFNLDIEPEGKNKIITYFTINEDLEGAADVIKIVRGEIDRNKKEDYDIGGEEANGKSEGEVIGKLNEVEIENDALYEVVDNESCVEDEDDSYSEEKEKELEHYLSEHLPALLDAIKECEQETEIKSLIFDYEGLSAYHLQHIFDFLQSSHITEFSVTGTVNLMDGMQLAAEKLKKTKLNKLSVDYCDSEVLYIAQVLEHTQITNLDIFRSFESCTEKWTEEFVSYLPKSQLTSLSVRASGCFSNAGAIYLADCLPSTAITHLDLSGSFEDSAALIFLFSILPTTSITELILNRSKITDIELRALSQTLRKSKLERLHLDSNLISDTGVNFLATSLVSSKVTDLSLAWNQISGKNDLGHCLEDTNVRILNLSSNLSINVFSFFPDFLRDSSISTLLLRDCGFSDEAGKDLMSSLKYSKVMELNVESNNLGLRTISEFANVVKNTNIIGVNFSQNAIPVEGFHILGECLKSSKVEHVKLSKNVEKSSGPNAFAVFIEKTKGSKISILDISENSFQKAGSEIIAKSLINTTVAHLNLSDCSIGDGILTLATCLKHTAITHLELRSNKIRDKGADVLSKCLAETQISMLDVSMNSITNNGAKSLASRLKDTSLYVLKLWGNKVDDQGIQDLAQIIEGTFVIEFGTKCYQSSKYLVIDTVLWKNQASVSRLLKFYKKIAPETSSSSFSFDHNLESVTIAEFLKQCLYFYKTVVEHPTAISAIAQDKTVSLSRQQITKLLLEEFPCQFTAFIRCKIEAGILQHFQFLEKAEAIGLNNLAELL